MFEGKYLDFEDAVNERNNFAKKFRQLAKEYVGTDPRYQNKI